MVGYLEGETKNQKAERATTVEAPAQELGSL